MKLASGNGHRKYKSRNVLRRLKTSSDKVGTDEAMKMYVPPRNELEQIPLPRKRDGYCGIAAMSAAIGISPISIYKAIPDWPGYTPSRMIISTLKNFGYDCKRVIVKKDEQRLWPIIFDHVFKTALGRIYFGDGKYVLSHWVCFKWVPDDEHPGLYDNAVGVERWLDTKRMNFNDFWPEPIKLKSLYFVEEE